MNRNFLHRLAAGLTAVLLAAGALDVAAQTPAAAAPARPAPPRPASTEIGVALERVIAIVNDEALTQYELAEQKRIALEQMKSQNIPPPAPDVLDKQLLDRLITERALLQYAKETGIRVDDVQVERTLARIAQDNKLTIDGLRQAIEKEGVPYAKYREDMRNEITMQRLREREVDSRITVSDTEVDNFLATVSAQSGGDTEYKIAHVLVLVPEQASSEQIEAKKTRAEEALKQLTSGADFKQVAAGFSDAPDALQGGSLGWRAPARLPTVFADQVRNMKPGQVSPILRSAAGFHIVKLEETRSRNAPTVVEQTRVRHILIRVNEVISESDAKAKAERIRERLDTGAKFEDQAKLNSDDPSAVKGGDLGWISPGDTVPEFEQAMSKLKIGELSQAVRSPFGWHLIQVSERRTQDITAERQREQARQALRQRKSDETFQEWIRQTRDRAYVEIKTDERG